MAHNRANRNASLVVLLTLLGGLFGCSGQEELAVMPPPPAPAPFNSQPVEISLGSSGSTLTLMTASDGSYTLGGEAFPSGETVTAANGNDYVLTLADGTWTAAFKPPAPLEVALGASGDSVTVTRAEDGSFSVADGETVTAANGNDYALTLADGTWTAVFKPPAPLEIALGASGDTVTVTRAEDGSFSVADGETVTAANGNDYVLTLADGTWTAAFKPPAPLEIALGASGNTVTVTRAEDGSFSVADGETVTATNGNNYVLTLADGTWTAVYRGLEQRVNLGTTRESVTLVRAEDGTYFLNGQLVESGKLHSARNGSEFELTQTPDGMWTATYQPVEQTVVLGTSGSLTLTRADNGSWSSSQGVVTAGTVVVGMHGVSYRLSIVNGYWSAQVAPSTVRIAGTGVRATPREDGRGYRVGTSGLLPSSGRGDITVEGAMYHVWSDGERLRGIRFDTGPHGNNQRQANYQIGLTNGVAELGADDKNTIANENGTTLLVGGGKFSIDRLLRLGRDSFTGDNFVANAREAIKGIRYRAELIMAALEDDTAERNRYVRGLWREAQAAIDTIFGQDTVVLEGTTEVDEVLGAFDEVLDALSSQAAFETATQEDGTGLFKAAEFDDTGARRAYRSEALGSDVNLGTTGDTRYGVVRTKGRNIATDSLTFNKGVNDLGAFAYSIIPDTQWSRDISSEGSATYTGGTLAVSGDGQVYTGDIELFVRFRSQTVSGLIKNIADEEGQPWTYIYSSVETVQFPEAQLTAQADWRFQVDPAQHASIVYLDKFFHPVLKPRSSFKGHLLGTGEDAGSQAVGVWSIGLATDRSNYLEGGFGAERVLAGPDEQPDPEAGGKSETTVASAGTEIGDGVLTLRGTQYGPNLETTATEADWDDLVLLLDEGRRIEETYQISLDQLLSREGYERAYLGRNLVDLARDEIGQLRAQLAKVIGAGDGTELWMQQRARIWDQINERVRARLFGTADNSLRGRDYLNDGDVPADDPRKWSSGYPVSGGGEPDDVQALAAVDAVLDALASPAALEAAIEENGAGVFTRENGKPFRTLQGDGIGEIWERSEARVELLLESTDYTRFGAWRKQTAPSAWSGYRDRLEDNENGPDSFAYSPLPQSRYSDLRFPAGGSATYRGETVAVQESNFFTGQIELVANWHASLQGESEAGLLTALIRDLRNKHGELLTYTVASTGTAPGIAIEALVLEGLSIERNAEDRLYFSDASPAVARLRLANAHYEDVDLAADPSIKTSVEGKFVGQELDGPLGVIGTWTLRDDGDTKIGTGDTLYGAFGAEVGP